MNNYEDNKAKHNVFAQAFLDNSEKLHQMAEIVSRGFDNAKANEKSYGSRESGARFAKKNKKITQKIATSPLSGRSFEGKRSLDYDRVATAAAIELGIENIIPQMSDEVKSAIVELISKGRSSLQPVTAWKNTKEAFHLIWDQKKKAPTTSRAAHKSASSGYISTFNNIIPQTAQNSNASEKNNLNGPKSKDDTIYDIDLLLHIRDQICYTIISS